MQKGFRITRGKANKLSSFNSKLNLSRHVSSLLYFSALVFFFIALRLRSFFFLGFITRFSMLSMSNFISLSRSQLPSIFQTSFLSIPFLFVNIVGVFQLFTAKNSGHFLRNGPYGLALFVLMVVMNLFFRPNPNE